MDYISALGFSFGIIASMMVIGICAGEWPVALIWSPAAILCLFNACWELEGK